MTKALLLENIDPVAVELLSSAGYEVDSRAGRSTGTSWPPRWTASTCWASARRPR